MVSYKESPHGTSRSDRLLELCNLLQSAAEDSVGLQFASAIVLSLGGGIKVETIDYPCTEASELMTDPALDKLKSAFVKALGVSPDSDFESMAYGQTSGWDSVAHMALIAAIESEFDIMLPTDEVIGMRNFLIAKEIVARNGVSFT